MCGTACATPRLLVKTLENLDKNLSDVQLYHFIVNGAIPFVGDCPQTRFYHKVFFVDTDVREIIKQGKADYIPISLTQIPNIIKRGGLSIDIALIQVSMPNKERFVSLGVSTDITHCVLQNAGKVIAEINPKCLGLLGILAFR